MKLFGAGSGIPTIALTASGNNYNIRSAAGNPTYKCNVVVTVPSGTTIATNGSGAALDTGTGWAAGTTITIIVNGYVVGFGGYGNGGAGGNAINLGWDVTIDCTNGHIFGGGGGGAAGVAVANWAGTPNYDGGGGGGGGQGNPGGTGGAGNGILAGLAGGNGSPTNRGSGGAGTHDLMAPDTIYGGNGGMGGAWGSAGDMCGLNSDGVGHYAGGPSGLAVKRNTKTVTWLGGYNSGQVKPYPVA